MSLRIRLDCGLACDCVYGVMISAGDCYEVMSGDRC